MLKRWQKEWQFLFRIFLFFLFIITCFRIVFLYFVRAEWIENGYSDALAALWYGTKLSLKSAEHPMFFLLLFCSLPIVFIRNFRWAEKWRNTLVFYGF